MTAKEMLCENAKLVENNLNIIFERQDAPEQLKEAMYYSLSAGGKRIRPALMLEFYRALGKNPADIINFACAVEMIHTYSLIHDDLPCMDNDDMRRGKPSCHVKFGEDTALLAGDALLTLAFETAADINENVDSAAAVKAINALAVAAGMTGMVGGQVLDLQSEGKSITIEELEQIQCGKTVALLKINAQIACILGGADKQQYEAACRYCESIGRAFQIRDDILDVIGDEATFGKPIGSDAENDKNTYVSLIGMDKSQQLVDELTKQAKQILDVFDDKEILCELADILKDRKK